MQGAGGWTGSQQHSNNIQSKSQSRAFSQEERRGKVRLDFPAAPGAPRLKAGGEKCPRMEKYSAWHCWAELGGSFSLHSHGKHLIVAPLPPSRGLGGSWHCKGRAFQGNGSIDPFSSIRTDLQHPKLPPSLSARELFCGDFCTVAEVGAPSQNIWPFRVRGGFAL